MPGRGRSAVGRATGDMQAAPARYVSVSELYSTDEVELLLDEIRELEPTSCRGEDVQVTTYYTYLLCYHGITITYLSLYVDRYNFNDDKIRISD